MRWTIGNLVVAFAFCLVLVFASAGGCDDKTQPKPKPAPVNTCNPGDTRAAKGHTDVCNENGKWEPMRRQIKP